MLVVISHNGLKALLITLKLLLVIFAIEVFTLYETLLLYYQAFLSQSAPLAEQHAGGD